MMSTVDPTTALFSASARDPAIPDSTYHPRRLWSLGWSRNILVGPRCGPESPDLLLISQQQTETDDALLFLPSTLAAEFWYRRNILFLESIVPMKSVNKEPNATVTRNPRGLNSTTIGIHGEVWSLQPFQVPHKQPENTTRRPRISWCGFRLSPRPGPDLICRNMDGLFLLRRWRCCCRH